MNSSNRSYTLLAVVAVAFAAGVLAHSSAARPVTAAPSSIATVDLSRVLENLEQHAQSVASLTRASDEIRAQKAETEAELAELATQLESASNDASRIDLEEELALRSLKFQAWLQFMQKKQDSDRALMLTSLYRSIKLAIAELAGATGYDAVFVDDSQGELTWSNDARLSAEAQVLQQISGRRLLFSSRGIDITDELVVRMNNAFQISGP